MPAGRGLVRRPASVLQPGKARRAEDLRSRRDRGSASGARASSASSAMPSSISTNSTPSGLALWTWHTNRAAATSASPGSPLLHCVGSRVCKAMHAGKAPSPGDEFMRRIPELHDPAVRRARRSRCARRTVESRWAMIKRGAAKHQAFQGFHDKPLRASVERGCGLVEDEHARILQQSPGNRQALALAPGQRSRLVHRAPSRSPVGAW
jgi:hypothetical protein